MILCDNLLVVYLSTNPTLHKICKHFDTDYYYIREQVSLDLIETKHKAISCIHLYWIHTKKGFCLYLWQIWCGSFYHHKSEGECKSNRNSSQSKFKFVSPRETHFPSSPTSSRPSLLSCRTKDCTGGQMDPSKTVSALSYLYELSKPFSSYVIKYLLIVLNTLILL